MKNINTKKEFDIKSINQWQMSKTDGIVSSNIPDVKWGQNLDDVDFSKPGILIIDDNEGICSFIKDDFEELSDDNKINLDDYNVFVFYGIMCAYELFATIQKYPNMNIQKAIIDITYSGTTRAKNGNIKLNGVDVFEVLYELNPELKYLFYTGNQMNNQIKIIGELMSKYNTISGKKITDNILFKTQFNMSDRQKYINLRLFK